LTEGQRRALQAAIRWAEMFEDEHMAEDLKAILVAGGNHA
jgi:hypothetical protein